MIRLTYFTRDVINGLLLINPLSQKARKPRQPIFLLPRQTCQYLRHTTNQPRKKYFFTLQTNRIFSILYFLFIQVFWQPLQRLYQIKKYKLYFIFETFFMASILMSFLLQATKFPKKNSTMIIKKLSANETVLSTFQPPLYY